MYVCVCGVLQMAVSVADPVPVSQLHGGGGQWAAQVTGQCHHPLCSFPCVCVAFCFVEAHM